MIKNMIEIKEKDENFRGLIWHRARKLLKAGYRTEAYILILATWNFARFRYFMTTFNLQKFEEMIERIQPLFDKLKFQVFEKADFSNSDLQNDIKTIYNNLKSIVEQTGATKIMFLTNPNLFVVWDTAIRNKYKISKLARAEDYIKFLILMKNKSKNIKSSGDKPLPINCMLPGYLDLSSMLLSGSVRPLFPCPASGADGTG